MPVSNKKHIFISHASLNNDVSEALYDRLTRQNKLACWIDIKDIHPDQGAFTEQIANAIYNANMLILVDTPEAKESDYVVRELQLAKDRRLPVYHYQPARERSPFWLNLYIRQLVLKLQLRMFSPIITAGLLLLLLLVALALVIFYMGTRVVPVIANSESRQLPTAIFPTPTLTAIPIPSDPKVAAPFHFKTDFSLLYDDFNDQNFEGSFNPKVFHFNITPNDKRVIIAQQNGSLDMFFPSDCLREEIRFDCEVQLNSDLLDMKKLQYFGFRARNKSRTLLRGVSVSVSYDIPDRSRAGFGWNFNDYAMAFFRTIPAIPEKELYAYVNVDTNWHAYEILRDIEESTYYYYVDGQLVDQYTLAHPQEWEQAPLQLIIYSLKANINNIENVDTDFQLDEVNIGGFK